MREVDNPTHPLIGRDPKPPHQWKWVSRYQEMRAPIVTVTSLKPTMPPRRPATFFNVQVTRRSAPVADCSAASIAASSAFWRFPAFEVPLNDFSVAMVVLVLGLIDTGAAARRWRGIHDAQIAALAL